MLRHIRTLLGGNEPSSAQYPSACVVPQALHNPRLRRLLDSPCRCRPVRSREPREWSPLPPCTAFSARSRSACARPVEEVGTPGQRVHKRCTRRCSRRQPSSTVVELVRLRAVPSGPVRRMTDNGAARARQCRWATARPSVQAALVKVAGLIASPLRTRVADQVCRHANAIRRNTSR